MGNVRVHDRDGLVKNGVIDEPFTVKVVEGKSRGPRFSTTYHVTILPLQGRCIEPIALWVREFYTPTNSALHDTFYLQYSPEDEYVEPVYHGRAYRSHQGYEAEWQAHIVVGTGPCRVREDRAHNPMDQQEYELLRERAEWGLLDRETIGALLIPGNRYAEAARIEPFISGMEMYY